MHCGTGAALRLDAKVEAVLSRAVLHVAHTVTAVACLLRIETDAIVAAAAGSPNPQARCQKDSIPLLVNMNPFPLISLGIRMPAFLL